MPEYPGLTPAQLEVSRALVASPRWKARPGLFALRADGSLVEVTHRSRPWPEGGVLYLPDAAVLGHLMELLIHACAGEVAPEIGCRPDGRSYCTLRARGGHERTWEGDLVAEAVGAALVERWRALDRRERRAV